VCVTSSGREDRQRFWTLDPGTIRYRDRREYEEHLRDLWAESVGARLRVEFRDVWAELSGGLDSSSVVCMADSLVKSRAVRARRIRPMSHVTLSAPEGDERRFIAEVEARTGQSSDILGIEEHEGDRDGASEWVSPCASRGIGLAALRHVRARGGQVVLSGRLGDLVMGCDPDNSVAVFDRLADGRPLSALAELRRWSRATRKPFVELVRALVIEGVELLNAGEAFREPALSESQRDSQALLSERIRNLWPEQERDPRVYSNVPLSKRRLAELFVGYPMEGLLAIPMLPHDITYAYPFAHRPLVEFMFAIPGEELSAPGETRSLMRRAFRGLVPDRILRRTSKGYYPPGATRAARLSAPTLLPVETLEVVKRGWFDPERLTAAIRTLLDGSGHSGGDVRRVLILEEWLASRHRRGPAAIPQRKEVTSHEVLNT
jgi:asparagine synthase (glutamine-hydrolysing)